MQTILGVDPALGGGNAIVAASASTEKLLLLDCEERFGFNRTEQQLEMIEQFVVKYRPSVVIIEFDAQQKGLGNDDRMREMAGKYGFVVQPHITRMEKQDPIFGVASMNQSFIRKEISIPWGDQASQDRMRPLVEQLRSWRPPSKTATGARAKDPRQDLVMALWFSWRWWFKQVESWRNPVAAVSQRRPSWIGKDRRVA